MRVKLSERMRVTGSLATTRRHDSMNKKKCEENLEKRYKNWAKQEFNRKELGDKFLNVSVLLNSVTEGIEFRDIACRKESLPPMILPFSPSTVVDPALGGDRRPIPRPCRGGCASPVSPVVPIFRGLRRGLEGSACLIWILITSRTILPSQ